MGLKRIGEGVVASRGGGKLEGRVFPVRDVGELLLRGSELDGAVLLVREAGVAGLATVLGKVSGVICTSGGVSSHIAILAREFGIPCIVAARIDGSVPEGRRVVVSMHDEQGVLYVEE